VRRDDLERDPAVELGVEGLEHDAHAAHAETLTDPVGPDQLTRVRVARLCHHKSEK
jgi:hypothetical protein